MFFIGLASRSYYEPTYRIRCTTLLNTKDMSDYENMRTADIIADALLDWNIDTIFGLPGDGINGFMEALRTRQDKLRFILVRHEESAAFMACAYAQYTGK
jgi:pyruvate dehydrogenase (quinone)